MGTLAELAVVWNLAKLGAAKPIILVGDVWQSVFEPILGELYVTPNEMQYFRFVDDPEGAREALREVFRE